jgi:hypothetical protein
VSCLHPTPRGRLETCDQTFPISVSRAVAEVVQLNLFVRYFSYIQRADDRLELVCSNGWVGVDAQFLWLVQPAKGPRLNTK